MEELPEALDRDALRLKAQLEKECDVVYPMLAGNEDEARRVGRVLRDEAVDLVLMYHATYVDDLMTLALIEETRGIFPVLLLSQGIPGVPEKFTPIEAGRCWGVNSAVQLPGSFRRLGEGLRFGLVFGSMDDDGVISEITRYAKAAGSVKAVRRMKVGVLPHRSAGVPMFDTYPDEARLIGQTGIRITYLYVEQLLDLMKQVSEPSVRELTDSLYESCEVVEPSREEVALAARQAIALERLVEATGIDALAIDMFPGLTPMCGMIPAVGMDRLIDQGVVVSSEGDLAVAVTGLIIRELCGRPVQFWEHSMFDVDKNWLLGGHEGGSAGFSTAKTGTRPRLRSTQYINFGKTPGAPYNGVVPEFITNPGPVTLATLFKGTPGYEMRLARGTSVDTHAREAHYEHTIFKPNIPLGEYFHRIAALGTCHHFALVHEDIWSEMCKVAEILGMRLEVLTD